MMSSARKMTSWDSRVMGDLYKFSGLQGDFRYLFMLFYRDLLSILNSKGEDHERGLLGCILRLWKNVFEE